jgi:pimeloyl-ACP methyl ester carboxylesterase
MTPTLAAQVTQERAVSRDGTSIGYLRVGDAGLPGLVLLHGAMEWSRSHVELAQALSDRFTVHLPDRRGRGTSGPFVPPYRVDHDVEDMTAVLDATGARLVMGVSSGAVVWLNTLLARGAAAAAGTAEATAASAGRLVERAVLFEPPLLADADRARALMAQLERELEGGEVDAALVTGMLGAEMGPAAIRRLPRGLLQRLTGFGADHEQRQQARRPVEGYVTMRELAPTLRQDFGLVAATSGHLDRFEQMSTPVLLLGGAKSPAYLRRGLDELERVLPQVERVELAGVGHEVTGNADRRGRPQVVADVVRGFLGG